MLLARSPSEITPPHGKAALYHVYYRFCVKLFAERRKKFGAHLHALVRRLGSVRNALDYGVKPSSFFLFLKQKQRKHKIIDNVQLTIDNARNAITLCKPSRTPLHMRTPSCQLMTHIAQ
jgi:hypothetical protein